MTNAKVTLKVFGQDDCRPCAVLKAVIEGEREELDAAGASFEYIDLTKGVRDDRVELIEKYTVMSTPVAVIERNGHVMSTIRGLVNIREIFDAIEYAKTAK